MFNISPFLINYFKKLCLDLLIAADKPAQDRVSGEPASPNLLLLQRTLSAERV